MIGTRVGALVLACALVAACGGSGKTSSSPSTAATRGTSVSAKVQAAPPGLAGVRGRVLVDGELRGFAPRGPRLAGFSAVSWVVVDRFSSSQRASASAELRRLGFVA